MKLKALILTAVLSSFSSAALAQWFPATVQVTVLPGQVAAQVYNPYPQPVICNGQVFGQTVAGPVFNAYFAEQFMPVGSYRYAFVQTNAFAPFIGGWANIHCRFVGWY